MNNGTNRFLHLPVIVGSLPVTLTNGSVADATQVMSDLNWLVNQVNANAAPLATTALVNVNNNFTAVQSGLAATQAAHFPIASQIQNSVFQTFQSTLGTNTITARCAALPLTSWPTDSVFSFIPSQTNTGPANLTVDSAGSSIIFSMGSTLVGGELRAGVPVFLKRDTSKLNMIEQANVRMDLASSTTGTRARLLIASTPGPITLGKQPSQTVLTSGSGTYNTPPGATRIHTRKVGGGGGGGAAHNITPTAGGNGGDTTFGTFTAGGGVGGTAGDGAATAAGGSGGTASGGNINIAGGKGTGSGAPLDSCGGSGGASAFGGNGGGGQPVNQNGTAGATNSGGGGGGAGGSSGAFGGGGGGSGAYVEAWINNPAPSYSYSVGAAGTAGSSAADSGGAGGSGIIIVEEFYN